MNVANDGSSEQSTAEVAEVTVDGVDEVRPLWGELLAHHQKVAPHVAHLGANLTLDESWAGRRAQYVDWFAGAAGRLWVARLDSLPVGYCFAHTAAGSNTWDWGARTGVLETLVVSRRVRGSGLGTRLFKRAQRYFVELELSVLKISVIAGNDAALRLYHRLGAVDQSLTLALPVSRVDL